MSEREGVRGLVELRQIAYEMRERQVARRFKSQTLIDWAGRIERAALNAETPPADAEQRANGHGYEKARELPVEAIERVMRDTYMAHDDYRLTSTLLHDMAVALAKHFAQQPEGVQAGEVEQRLAEDRALLEAIRDVMGGGAYDTLPKRIASALSQQPEARGVVDEDAAEALRFLLDRIGSWTYSRWDQHLRYKFGDERANRMIATLTEARNGR